MDNFELLDEHLRELGLTPQQVMERWIENGQCDPFLIDSTQSVSPIASSLVRSGRNRRHQIYISEAKVYFDDPAKQQIFVTLRRLIAQVFGIDADMIQPSSNFSFDLGADSLDVVELVQEIEREFNCSVSDQQAEELVTVQSWIDFLTKLNK